MKRILGSATIALVSVAAVADDSVATDTSRDWHDTDHGCERLAGQAGCQALVFGVSRR